MESKLNDEQEKAANVVHGTFAVIAVPGSGKTRTMMERIGKLVNIHGIPPESILGMTFTRNAATEMRNRLFPILGEKAERVLLQTIHGFCLMLLKREGVCFEIISERDQLILIKKIMKELRIKDVAPGMAIREISLAKNNLITHEDFSCIHDDDSTMKQISQIYEAYDREKKKVMLMDFDDLLVETYEIFKTSERARNKYSSIYRHVLIDEYQDTNPLQLELMKLLLNDKKDSSFFVVGDDWQNIFGFAGSTVANILKFEENFSGAEIFHLTWNYRSTPQILEACKNLIDHNIKKIDKELRTDNSPGQAVVFLECSNEADEGRIIASEINALVSNGQYQHKEIAILYRANYQSRAIEEVLSEAEIPYHIEAGLNYYERREVKVLLDYLRVINNPSESDEALKRIMNLPTRYISNKLVSGWEDYADDNGMSLYQAMRSMHVDNPFIRKNVRQMIQFLDRMMESKDTLSTPEIISDLRTTLDLDRFLTDDDIPSSDDIKIKNMDELTLSSARYTIPELLQYSETFKESKNHDKDGVNLMTIHKAKGLEFEVVFIVGLVEGILPSKRGDIEEERRICFVGMSRAKKLLYLSYFTACLNGMTAKRAIFIDEIRGTK
jgi:DNA helicase-2/ATP-dependent DNA helicase PcrA